MLQLKCYEQKHTHYRVACRKNYCHLTKQTLTDTDTPTYTETLMDTESRTDMEPLLIRNPRHIYGNLEVYSNLVRSQNPDLDRNSVG
jgi:hypothetical protein